MQKTQQDTFYLMPSVLIFLLKKRSFHANPLCIIIHYLENVVSSGGWGGGEGKEDHYGQKLAYLHL